VISKSREGPDVYPVRNLSWGGDCIIRNVCVGPENRNQGSQPQSVDLLTSKPTSQPACLPVSHNCTKSSI